MNKTVPGKSIIALVLATLLPGLVLPGAALADSCWNHNGSVMRLQRPGQPALAVL